jgi:flagellar assembly protein FliH
MTGMKLQRFDFATLRDFRGPIVVKAAEEAIQIEPPAPPPPVFSEADMESARLAGKKEGYNEGFHAGMAQANADSDLTTKEANEVIQRFGETIATLDARYRELLTKESADLSALVLLIARKVAGEALDERSIETLTAMVSRCLPVLFSKPRIIIDTHPEMLERVLERMETHLRAHGFEGDIQFRSNATLHKHDIALDWGAGQAIRSTDMLWQEIETLITRIPLEITFAHTLQTAAQESPNDIEKTETTDTPETGV